MRCLYCIVAIANMLLLRFNQLPQIRKRFCHGVLAKGTESFLELLSLKYLGCITERKQNKPETRQHNVGSKAVFIFRRAGLCCEVDRLPGTSLVSNDIVSVLPARFDLQCHTSWSCRCAWFILYFMQPAVHPCMPININTT